MRRFSIICCLALAELAGISIARADWLGLMQNGSAVDLPGTSGSQSMAIRFNQNNDGLAVVTQQNPTFFNLLPTFQSYGGMLWNPQLIPINNTSLLGVGDVRDPEMDILSSGLGMCVYAQFTQGRFRIFGARYDGNFLVVNNTNPLDTPIGFNAEQPSVVQVDDQLSILTYLQNNGTNNRIFSSRWDANGWAFWSTVSGGWTTTGQGLAIDGPETVNASRPHLARNSLGDVFCVYAKESTNKGIYASLYRNQQWYYWGVGGWIPAGQSANSAAISLNDSNLDADRPRLASLGNGRMMCVYETQDRTNTSTRVHYTLYDGQNWIPGNSGAWVDAFAVTVNASAPDLASSLLQKVICVYAKGNTGTSTQRVYASEWDGSSWLLMNQSRALDSLGNSATPISPKISFDNLGNAIALFQQWDASAPQQTRVFANYFQGPPSISGITPDGGKNNGRIAVVVAGYNFAGGALPQARVRAWLRKSGQPDIAGENIVVATPTQNLFTARSFTVEFNLNQAAVGDWDLVVQNPDGQFFVAPAIFGVTWPDLGQAYAYPNPIRTVGTGPQSAKALRFFNLVRSATVKIYTARGEFVRALQKDDRLLYLDWDLTNTAGRNVAPGVYLYRIESPEGSLIKGKVVVIR